MPGRLGLLAAIFALSVAWVGGSPFFAPAFHNIDVLDLASGEIRSLPSKGFVERPTWSPDASTIYYTAQPAGTAGASTVFAVHPDGTDTRPVLTEPWAFWQADWRS